jgi:cytoskeletal protein CcmA (bactofilin family)
MALWKDAGSKDPVTPVRDTVTPLRETPVTPTPTETPAPAPTPAPRPRAEAKESVIAEGLTLEGKIEGSGHVRLAGRFKGDVNVDGTLTIEQGAHLAGSVKAGSVIVGGELEGNILGAGRVELQQTGIINGDVAAASLSVAAGSRMRGRVEFGWGEAGGAKAAERK